jgi:hypothetical protein
MPFIIGLSLDVEAIFEKRRTKYTSGHILTKREGGADEQEL